MAESLPEPRLTALHAFLEALAGGSLPGEALLSGLMEQGLMELALIELKRQRPRMEQRDPWFPVRKRMEAEVAQARTRRMHQWQLDPARRTLRFRMEVRTPACDLHPPALQAALAQALLASGLPLAMGLEKTPRPLVRLGHPLPPGVEGFAEWAEAILRGPSAHAGEALAEHINAHCPEGLRILHVEQVPSHASAVLDLCAQAHWAWACAPELRATAFERLARFQASDAYEISKTGKVDGQKQSKRVEVRRRVLAMGWEGDTLRFSTHLSAGEAMSPIKLLAGILDVEPSAIRGLVRVGVALAEDPRLASGGKFETKLHNIYEDAVLLDSDLEPRPSEEEDDEPILLKRGIDGP